VDFADRREDPRLPDGIVFFLHHTMNAHLHAGQRGTVEAGVERMQDAVVAGQADTVCGPLRKRSA